MPTEPKIDNPFEIDDRDLWGEWTRMASRTRAAGIRVADARHAYHQAKSRADVERARLFHDIRKNPGKYDLDEKKSPSNEVTASMVEIQPSYIRAVDDMNRAKRDLDYTEADAEAFLTMRKSLENLVELQAMQWHSEREPRAKTPGTRDDAREARDRDATGGGVRRGGT